MKRLATATKRMEATGVSHEEAQRQWDMQREYQSRILTRQSKKAGERAVNAILEIMDNLHVTQRRLAELSQARDKWTTEEKARNPDVWATALEEIDQKRAGIGRMMKAVEKRTAQLQQTDPVSAAHLEKMRTNKFYDLLMNMRALLVRLRVRLRERKFELANMERAYRSQMMGEHSSIFLLTPSC